MKVFVAGGQVAGLTAFAPAALANTHVHLFAGSGAEGDGDGWVGRCPSGRRIVSNKMAFVFVLLCCVGARKPKAIAESPKPERITGLLGLLNSRKILKICG